MLVECKDHSQYYALCISTEQWNYLIGYLFMIAKFININFALNTINIKTSKSYTAEVPSFLPNDKCVYINTAFIFGKVRSAWSIYIYICNDISNLTKPHTPDQREIPKRTHVCDCNVIVLTTSFTRLYKFGA